MENALREKPKGTMHLVVGDLNVNNNAPISQEEDVLSQEMGGQGLECATCHFQVCRCCHVRGRSTWRQQKEKATTGGERRWIQSRPDYILFPAKEQMRLKRCRCSPPSPLTLTTGHWSLICEEVRDSSATQRSKTRLSRSNHQRPGSSRRGRRCSGGWRLPLSSHRIGTGW